MSIETIHKNHPPVAKLLRFSQALTVSIVLFIASTLTSFMLYFNSQYELKQYLTRTAESLAISATPALTFNDVAECQNILDSLRTDADIVYGEIMRKDEKVASYTASPKTSLEEIQASPWGYIHYQLDLKDMDETHGQLHLIMSVQRAVRTTLVNIAAIFGASILALFIGLAFARKMERKIIDPLNETLAICQGFAKEHNYSISKAELSKNAPMEIEEIFNGLVNMILQIKTRDRLLQDSNKNLEEKVKQRTKELKDAQQQLLQEAHKAGIAEVATGVLHNIGNVLNTVTTNTNLLEDQERQGVLLAKLEKLVTSFQEHKEDLPEFLAEDNRGPLSVDYLTQVHLALKEESKSKQATIKKSSNAVNIITDIIRDQQALASKKFSLASMDLRQTLEQTLELKKSFLARSRVHVEIEGDMIPEVPTQRARIIQVFVNLLSNSSEAFPNDQSRRNIVIELKDKPETVEVIFHDNGPGVPQKLLDRLFQYGATTKANGHGFGLHSCHSYMKDLGGDLRYQKSEKLGGACFIIEVPKTPPKTEQV